MAAKDITMTTILVMIVMVSGMFAGMVHFVQGMNTEYTAQIDDKSDEFSSTLSKMGTINSSVSNAQVTVNESGTYDSDQLGTIFLGMPKFFTILANAIQESGDIVAEIAEVAHLPSWFVSIIIVSIFVIIMGLFLSAVFNRRI